jgi:hypothetical protein
MEVIRSGIEVTPEELKKKSIPNRNIDCPLGPVGCSGQPGTWNCRYKDIEELEDREH